MQLVVKVDEEGENYIGYGIFTQADKNSRLKRC